MLLWKPKVLGQAELFESEVPMKRMCNGAKLTSLMSKSGELFFSNAAHRQFRAECEKWRTAGFRY